MRHHSRLGLLLATLALALPQAAGAQQPYPQIVTNQLMTLTAIALAAQLCGVPMSDDTKKTISNGLERLGNSQTDLDEQAYHKAVEDMAKKISGDLEHACIQINNQDLPSLVDKILQQ